MHETPRTQCQNVLRHFSYRDTQTHDRNFRLRYKFTLRYEFYRFEVSGSRKSVNVQCMTHNVYTVVLLRDNLLLSPLSVYRHA